MKERTRGEIGSPEHEREAVRGRSGGGEALGHDRGGREVRVHRRREAHERLSAGDVVEPRTALDTAPLPAVREAHHGHRRHGLDQGGGEEAEHRVGQLARLRLDEEAEPGGEECRALHDPLHVRVAGAPGADVELAGEVGVAARQLAPVLAERGELGEVRLDERLVHHVAPAPGRASSSTRAPSPPSRRGTSTRSRSMLQPSAYVLPSIS